jgi:plasmid maintenance system antidote protein VapI
VPLTLIGDMAHERRGVTADTALRFARYFRTAPAFWMNLQTRYDLEVAEDRIAVRRRRVRSHLRSRSRATRQPIRASACESSG